jgi:hypothetical protein
MHEMMAQSARLLFALGGLGIVLAGPAFLAGGPPAIVGLGAAVLVCLLPGLVVLRLQAGVLARLQPLTSLMLAMGLRMAFVLIGALLIRQLLPEMPAAVFLIWLVPAYLVALAVETRMALAQDGGRDGAHLASSRPRVSGSRLNEHPAN